MTETIAAEELGWKLAALEKDCSRTDLQANISDDEALRTGSMQVIGYHMLTCDCSGTHRVPMFPGARAGCPEIYADDEGYHFHECRCHGLGYTPSTDLAVWLAIPYAVRFEGDSCIVRLLPTSIDYWGRGGNRLEALQDALWKAVGERTQTI